MKSFTDERLSIVDVIRHGECEGGEIYRGSTNVALTERGWSQMKSALLSDQPKATPWDKVITSPLVRCCRFAEHLSTQLDIPMVVENDLREMNFGQWEGKAVRLVHEQFSEQVKAFYQSPDQVTPTDGEPVSQVQERVLAVFWRHFEQNQGDRMLFIQHGVTMRVLIVGLLGLPLVQLGRFDIPYAGRVQFKIYTKQNQQRRVVLSMLC